MTSLDPFSIVKWAQSTLTTRFLVPNLHCPTCVPTVESALLSLDPKPLFISTSILTHSVLVRHMPSLRRSVMRNALREAGFDVHGTVLNPDTEGPDLEVGQQFDDEEEGLATGVRVLTRWWHSWRERVGGEAEKRRRRHIAQCAHCQAEEFEKRDHKKGKEQKLGLTSPVWNGGDSAPNDLALVVVDSATSTRAMFRASLAIEGMTCSSCVGIISDTLGQRGWVRSVDVNLLSNSATVLFEGKENLSDLVLAIQDLGYEANVDRLDVVESPDGRDAPPTGNTWRASFAIGGMTCSSCVGTITDALRQEEWVESVEVNLITNSAVVIFQDKGHLRDIIQAIEDAGYEVTLDEMANVDEQKRPDVQRDVAIRVAGLDCAHCPKRISDALDRRFGDRVQITKLPTLLDPILSASYTPQIPDLTIREIVACISTADADFEPSIYHPASLEERSRAMLERERGRILLRLALSVAIAIPTFIIGIVLMTLVDSANASRRYIMEPAWAGSVSRGQWALFILATPVYFFAADVFHRRMFKELRALWRPRSTTPILRRFYRFGSMNMLISLGTSIAYFSSIAELVIAATQSPNMATSDAAPSYFDSVVFLTMFLLVGRFLEAFSKARTGDAVTLLGKLRPTEVMLVESTKEASSADIRSQAGNPLTRKIPVDFLEVGDTIRIPNGGAPAFDGIIIAGGVTQFDESSLTGESRPVTKHLGDEVYAGTINKASPVSVRITALEGASVLDQIISVVREGQARRAPIERVADVITSLFVPLVILLGVSTWIAWLVLGLSGALPASFRDGDNVGGWAFWSLQFSIAVFVIACPCGIGLAAPTALFVGGGLAAQHGILVRGGGEAFQEASRLDCIVFDKTGTLTEGGEPSVTDYKCLPAVRAIESKILGMVKGLEENSSHPVARAVVSFCDSKPLERSGVLRITEIPGKGMSGVSSLSSSEVEIILGNEALMLGYGVKIDSSTIATLNTWKSQGKSVALFAIKAHLESSRKGEVNTRSTAPWTLSAVFAVSDKLRPEAASVVRALQSRSVDVWMISGDNPTTAKAVAKMVGISEHNVIAGVLPDQKAQKIQYLQLTLERKSKHGSRNRATVAMVGDGINDAPALTMADVGIAIGSGSDVAISSAEFVLMSSSLKSLLVLIDLSRTVFRRVWFNFAWALVYNLIALPIAAGVLYPVISNGRHVRLDPVWASLAMAMSSVSVVCSSLLLRSKLPGVGFRAGAFSGEN